MLYVQDILLPDEKILHYAKVHYILYAPGALLLLIAVALTYYMPDITLYFGYDYVKGSLFDKIIKFIAISCYMGGFAMLLRAWLHIYSTEVVVTTMRVLVKVGISTATTAEIDRHRISSVVVTKPIIGRVLNYGWVTILGYSGNITGLPVLANPHEIQKHIYQTRDIKTVAN